MIRIANIVNDSIVDGPGLRFTVFTQGCHHGCLGCHNPDTHDIAGGEEVSIAELVAKMKANTLLDGLTISGGEPFLQANACASLARAARDAGLSVWVYTGSIYEDLISSNRSDWMALLEETDILVDGPYIEKLRSCSLSFRGSDNQRHIDIPKSMKAGKAVIWEPLNISLLGKFKVPES